MAKNDTILIDGILDDRIAEHLPSDRRDEAFEYFAVEQILRDADLSQDEIKSGCIDGRDDGGIDGFYIIVNGHLLTDPDSFIWPRSGCELELWIITCKHHDTFRQAPVDNLVASVTELFDLAIPTDELRGAYSISLIKSRKCLIAVYRKVSSRLTHFTVNFVYVSRGDSTNVGASISSRAKQAVKITDDLFGNCNSSFKFIGASELISIHRKVRTFSLELPFLEALTRGERYILLCRLTDFHNFVVDENQKLRRYLFDSNVRAFMGLNRVNEDIRDTLNEPKSPDFWWLNNGITILANSATVAGKSIQLEGVQIVNGLQTTESIVRFFCDGNSDPHERSVLVKIVVTTDASIRDSIIRATNNQTTVELSSLHATDKIQRDIEDVLLRAGLFYERRTNHYSNQGHPATHIISPLYIASGFINLVLKSPSSAARLRSRFMRSEVSYNQVFSQSAPIKVWPVIARILKTTDNFLERIRTSEPGGTDRFLKKWRQILSFIATARVFEKFTFTANELVDLDLNLLSVNLLESSWELVNTSAKIPFSLKTRKGKTFTLDICKKAAELYMLEGVEIVERMNIGSLKGLKPDASKLIEQVDKALPVQPWKPGIHREVAKKLGIDSNMAYNAIERLIKSGRRYFQKDGVIYAPDGSVLEKDDNQNQIDP